MTFELKGIGGAPKDYQFAPLTTRHKISQWTGRNAICSLASIHPQS